MAKLDDVFEQTNEYLGRRDMFLEKRIVGGYVNLLCCKEQGSFYISVCAVHPLGASFFKETFKVLVTDLTANEAIEWMLDWKRNIVEPLCRKEKEWKVRNNLEGLSL